MIAKPVKLIVSMSGQVFGRRSPYYVRTIRKTGVIIVQRKGNPYKNHKPSPAQLAQQQRFAEMVRQRWKNRTPPPP